MLLRDEDIELIAARFRDHVGISDCVFIDGLTLLQKVRRFYGVGHLGVDALPPNSEGEFDDQKKIIRVPESVLWQSYWSNPRARMTIAHEVAHVVLGHIGIVNRSLVKTQAETLSKLVARQEREAKRLAPAILAPFKFMNADMAVEDISFRFGLGRQAAEIRRAQYLNRERRINGVPRPLPQFVVDLQRELSATRTSPKVLRVAPQKCQRCGLETVPSASAKFLCSGCGTLN
jgi:hypothetical protein